MKPWSQPRSTANSYPPTRGKTQTFARATASKCSPRCREAEMLEFYGKQFESRLLLGTAQYPSPSILAESVRASKTEIVTVSLRRESGNMRAGQDFWALIKDMGVSVLPNTAGCHTPREAVTTAKMAREIFGTNWIKL